LIPFKSKMSATNFRFLTFSLYHIIELEQSFPKMYSLYKAIFNRFRDKRQKTPGVQKIFKQTLLATNIA